MQEWCDGRRRATVISLPTPGGKAAALAEAWLASPGAELTAVYDADVRPAPDALRLLACEFSEPHTGAASGSVWPANSTDSAVARYAALELFTFHQVIQSARDRLGLNPLAVGAHCVYRTNALAEVGGFRSDRSIGEDVQTSCALIRAGWRTRFQARARVFTRVPTRLTHFWKQRQRWARNSSHALSGAPGLAAFLTATGYMDRLVFLAAVVAAQAGVIRWWWPLAFFAGPALNVAVGLWKARVASPIQFLIAAVPMFAVDVGVSLAGSVQGLLPTGRRASGGWNRPL
jgi:cellulose synthase/poly-beta-1,6-N-acetylglucosamine synthase-like glycosyltransferase